VPIKLKSILRVIRLMLFCTSMLFVGCKSSQKNKGIEKINVCLQDKIDAFKKTTCAEGACVKQYQFQKTIVYAFIPGNCGADLSTDIVNSSCETIGFLGGIMGNTKINGEEFSQAVLVKSVWEKTPETNK